jgi:hypothetical protein
VRSREARKIGRKLWDEVQLFALANSPVGACLELTHARRIGNCKPTGETIAHNHALLTHLSLLKDLLRAPPAHLQFVYQTNDSQGIRSSAAPLACFGHPLCLHRVFGRSGFAIFPAVTFPARLSARAVGTFRCFAAFHLSSTNNRKSQGSSLIWD